MSRRRGQHRSVAQPGRAPRSGRGGRRFKSCRSDQHLRGAFENPQLSVHSAKSEAPEVHKGVHRSGLRMVTLVRGSDGAYRARKRLPADVREEYGRQYGAHHEAKFFRPATTKPNEAKRDFGEWVAEVEARIDAIRKHRKGEGIALNQIGRA